MSNKKATTALSQSDKKTNNIKKVNKSQVTETQVVRYLEQYPQFFVDKHPLLAKMTLLPMQQGSVYDFTACQIAYLQQKNQQLTDRSTHLFDLVQHNRQIMTHTQEVVDNCLSATSRTELIEQFCTSWQEPFQLPANVLLFNYNKQPNALARLLNETRFESIYCGTILSEESIVLFGNETLCSVVLSRFQFKKNQQALLVIGSVDEKHFHNQLDTSAFRLVQSIFQYQLNRLR